VVAILALEASTRPIEARERKGEGKSEKACRDIE
jgi:hypothetical protein